MQLTCTYPQDGLLVAIQSQMRAGSLKDVPISRRWLVMSMQGQLERYDRSYSIIGAAPTLQR